MDKYEIVFKGEVMPSLEVEQVAAALATLFRTSEEKIAPLFSGSAHTLKSGLDRGAAESYRDTLKRAGAIVYLRRAGIPARATGERSATDGLSLAPRVGNLIREEERPVVNAVEVDTSGIELAANNGSPLAPPASAASPAPDTSQLSIAETGADLNPNPATPAPSPPINIGDLSLAPADIERLVEAPPAPNIPLPDTSALQVEPAGEILKQHEKAKPVPAPPLLHDFDLYPRE
jgi:hypothetical protein